jgi:hypothetical protein
VTIDGSNGDAVITIGGTGKKRLLRPMGRKMRPILLRKPAQVKMWARGLHKTAWPRILPVMFDPQSNGTPWTPLSSRRYAAGGL